MCIIMYCLAMYCVVCHRQPNILFVAFMLMNIVSMLDRLILVIVTNFSKNKKKIHVCNYRRLTPEGDSQGPIGMQLRKVSAHVFSVDG